MVGVLTGGEHGTTAEEGDPESTVVIFPPTVSAKRQQGEYAYAFGGWGYLSTDRQVVHVCLLSLSAIEMR